MTARTAPTRRFLVVHPPTSTTVGGTTCGTLIVSDGANPTARVEVFTFHHGGQLAAVTYTTRTDPGGASTVGGVSTTGQLVDVVERHHGATLTPGQRAKLTTWSELPHTAPEPRQEE